METCDMKQQCKYLSFKIEKSKQDEILTKTIECLKSKKVIKEYVVYVLNLYTFQFIITFKTYTSIKFINNTLSSITELKTLNLKEYKSLMIHMKESNYNLYSTYINPNTKNTDDLKPQTTKEEQSENQHQPQTEEIKTEILTKEKSQPLLEEFEEVQESQSSIISQIPKEDDTTNNITSSISSLKDIFTPIQKYFIYGNNQQNIFKKITEIMTEQKIQNISQINYSIKNNYWEGIIQNSNSLLLIVDFKIIPIIDILLFDLFNWCNSTIKTSTGYVEKRYKHVFIVYSQYLDLSNSIQDLKTYTV